MSADASKWEVSDVIKFLESVGFSQEAKNFAEQVDKCSFLTNECLLN